MIAAIDFLTQHCLQNTVRQLIIEEIAPSGIAQPALENTRLPFGVAHPARMVIRDMRKH